METFVAGSNYLLDAAGGGVGLADAHDSDISEEIWEEVDAVFEMLVAGDLETGVDPVSGDLATEEPEMEATEEATEESGD
jgi:hypothetical protein